MANELALLGGFAKGLASGVERGESIRNTRLQQQLQRRQLALAGQEIDIRRNEAEFRREQAVIERETNAFNAQIDQVRQTFVDTLPAVIQRHQAEGGAESPFVKQFIAQAAVRLTALAQGSPNVPGAAVITENMAREISNIAAGTSTLAEQNIQALDAAEQALGRPLDEQQRQVILGTGETQEQEQADLEANARRTRQNSAAAAAAAAANKGVQQVNLLMPDGTVESFDGNREQAEIANARNRGGRFVNQISGTVEDISVATRTTGEMEDIRASFDNAQQSVATLDNAILSVTENPDAVGLAGPAIAGIGGVAVQIAGWFGFEQEARELGLTEEVERVTKVRTDLITTLGQLIGTVTGEPDNPRYTDQDRELATEALQVLRAWASAPQVIAALETTREVIIRGELYDLARLIGQSGIDLSSEDGWLAVRQELIKLGVTSQTKQAQLVKGVIDRLQ